MWETWVRSLIGKIPWRRAWQPTPVFLPGETPWTEEPGRLQSMGSQRIGHDSVTNHTQHVHVKSFQSCPTLFDPMNWSPPGSSVHELLQARILVWVAISSSGGFSWPRDHFLCLLQWRASSLPIAPPTKVCIVKAMVFLVVMYRYERWAIKKAERWRIDAFELWCWRRLLRVLWTARRSNKSILKEINLNIHWKDCYCSWSSNTLATWCKGPAHWERPWCWERLKAGGEGGNRGWDG